MERLNRERELVGIYLSAHPLDDYAVVLRTLCNRTCQSIGQDSNKEELSQLDAVTIGGIVTGMREGFTKRGTPYGIVTIEDYDGAGELAIFDDWGQWRGMFMEGSALYIKLKYEKKYPTSTYINTKILSIEQLCDVRDNNIDKITIMVNVDNLDSLIAEELTEKIKKCKLDASENAFNGKVAKGASIYFQCTSARSLRPSNLYTSAFKIKIDKELLDYLDMTECFDYRVN